jgi:4-amino-4-deoxy-L-arabinose transferase-like glycosyltransferase
MNPIKNIPAKYWVTALALLMIYILGFRFDMVIDAGKYAAISKHIYETGDLIHLQVYGEPYEQKPPFMFWLSALSFQLFGLSNFSFKLPTFLFTLAGTYATFRLGELLYNKRIGTIASIMLISSQCMILYNNDTHTDVILTMNIVIGLWQLLKFIKERKWLNYFAGFIFIGFAVITKGPLGLAVPVFAVISHLLITKNYQLMWPHYWLPGLFIVATITSPALIGLYEHFGIDGIKFFFFTNNIGRITGKYIGNSTDYFFYLHTLAYIMLPFSILIFFSSYQEIKIWVKNKFSFSNAIEGMSLAIPLFLAILTISKAKSPNYMMPVIPLMTIIAAKWADRLSQREWFTERTSKALITSQFIVLGILLIGILFLPIYSFPTTDLKVWIPIVTFYSITIYFASSSKKLCDKLIFVPILAIISVNMIITIHFFPMIYQFHATSKVSKDFNHIASENAKIFILNTEDFELGYYAKNEPRAVTDSTLSKIEMIDDLWVYADSLGRDTLIYLYPESETIRHYKYRRVSRISPKFLNPKTRFSELDDMYLLKINKK